MKLRIQLNHVDVEVQVRLLPDWMKHLLNQFGLPHSTLFTEELRTILNANDLEIYKIGSSEIIRGILDPSTLAKATVDHSEVLNGPDGGNLSIGTDTRYICELSDNNHIVVTVLNGGDVGYTSLAEGLFDILVPIFGMEGVASDPILMKGFVASL